MLILLGKQNSLTRDFTLNHLTTNDEKLIRILIAKVIRIFGKRLTVYEMTTLLPQIVLGHLFLITMFRCLCKLVFRYLYVLLHLISFSDLGHYWATK